MLRAMVESWKAPDAAVRHNILVACGVTISGWPSLVRIREADHHRINSSDPWATCSHHCRETKLRPHMIRLISNDGVNSHRHADM